MNFFKIQSFPFKEELLGNKIKNNKYKNIKAL